MSIQYIVDAWNDNHSSTHTTEKAKEPRGEQKKMRSCIYLHNTGTWYLPTICHKTGAANPYCAVHNSSSIVLDPKVNLYTIYETARSPAWRRMSKKTSLSHILPFPAFGAEWIKHRMVVVTGGGGASKTGIPNGVIIYRVSSSRCMYAYI